MIAIEQIWPDFSEIVRSDLLAAQHAKRFAEGRPAVHQHESHVAPPNAKQKTCRMCRSYEMKERTGGVCFAPLSQAEPVCTSPDLCASRSCNRDRSLLRSGSGPRRGRVPTTCEEIVLGGPKQVKPFAVALPTNLEAISAFR